ncbi:MAG: mismatch repair protein MutS domain protein [Paenibacillus sp.]|nr:mismatch repair protein MutS domain protein [Paenibacillus sp.]
MNQEAISLLWPTEQAKMQYKDDMKLNEQTITDFGLDRLVQELSINYAYNDDIKKLILNVCDDREVIQYRLDVLEDFVQTPELASEFEALLPLVHRLSVQHQTKMISGAETLRKIAWQLEAMDVYVQCVDALKLRSNRFGSSIQSPALKKLFAFIDEMTANPDYQTMAASLPDYRRKLQGMSSVTIGINLDPELKPAEAVILSLEEKPFKQRKNSLLTNLLGLKSMDDTYEGMTQFQNIRKLGHGALDTALLKSLEDIFNDALLPIGNAIKRYIDINIPAITNLEMEIGFYVGASKFIGKMVDCGLTMTKPIAAPAEERICRISNMVDPILAIGLMRQHPGFNLSNTIVANDIEFGPTGRVYILTGPNQGGKTTYTRAIGLAQLLFQAGLYVPGREAVISPVDRIFTHFSEEEKPNINNGRLGEESKRLSEIFMSATRHSLILLNESLSSTSNKDSLHLARDIVKGMKMLGCRAVFATHLLELAANVEQINDELPSDSRLVSMVSGVERDLDARLMDISKAKRTYKVLPGPPNEISFAKDIAYLYGISFEQIVQTLKDRKVIDR